MRNALDFTIDRRPDPNLAGFISWFDEELKQMLERDAADFKMYAPFVPIYECDIR